MDGIISTVKKHSFEGDYVGLIKKLDAANCAKTFKKASPSSIDAILNDTQNQLNPAQHTIGYAELLSYKAGNIEFKNHLEFIEQCRYLFHSGSEIQFPYCIKQLAIISRHFTKSCLLANVYSRGVSALRSLVYKFTSSIPSQLTSIHSDFLQLCLKAHMANIACVYLNGYNDCLTSISPKESGIETADYLCFHYYAGNCHSIMKQWQQAVNSYELCLSLPTTSAISAIQMHAYSRLQIVNILNQRIASNSEVQLSNKTVSPSLLRHLDTLSGHYTELNRIYRRAADKGSLEELNIIIANNLDAFRSDKTFGLIRQLAEHAINQHIHRLTNTYLTLSINNIKDLVHLQDTKAVEKYLIFNTFNYLISSRIDCKAGMVEFNEGEDNYNSTKETKEMNEKIKQVHLLARQFKAKDRKLQLNPIFIAKTMPHSVGPNTMDMEQIGGGGGGGRGRGGVSEDDMMKMALAQSMIQQ